MRKKQEKQIASEAKTNPKKFWNFTKSQTKVKEGVSNLKVGDSVTTSDEENAEPLLDQYSSVFTARWVMPTSISRWLSLPSLDSFM